MDLEEFGGEVAIAQFAVLLNQPPSVIKKETMRDLAMVATVKTAQARMEKEEMEKSMRKSRGETSCLKR